MRTDINIESKGGILPGGKVMIDRAELRATLIGIGEEIESLVDAGRLIFKDGRAVPTGQ